MRAQDLRQCGRPERVVDVVEPRQRQPDAGRAFRRLELERDAFEPVELDRACPHLERRPGVATGGTVVVAEMADVGGCELVRPAAADAVARVGRVLQRRPCMCGIVDAEGDRAGAVAAEVADLRIVPVDHEHRFRWQEPRSPSASWRRCARARRSGRAGRERGFRAARRAAARGAQSRAARPRRPRGAPAPRRAVSGAWTRRRRRGLRPSGSRRGGASVRGSRRPSRSSSSCRSWPRRPQHRPAAGLQARRSRSDRASTAACPAASYRRLRRPGATACPPRERRGTRLRDGHSSAGESTGWSLDRVNFARPNPKG